MASVTTHHRRQRRRRDGRCECGLWRCGLCECGLCECGLCECGVWRCGLWRCGLCECLRTIAAGKPPSLLVLHLPLHLSPVLHGTPLPDLVPALTQLPALASHNGQSSFWNGQPPPGFLLLISSRSSFGRLDR